VKFCYNLYLTPFHSWKKQSKILEQIQLHFSSSCTICSCDLWKNTLMTMNLSFLNT
jgi:hypothetical protein